jgi:hypothetical protein
MEASKVEINANKLVKIDHHFIKIFIISHARAGPARAEKIFFFKSNSRFVKILNYIIYSPRQ